MNDFFEIREILKDLYDRNNLQSNKVEVASKKLHRNSVAWKKSLIKIVREILEKLDQTSDKYEIISHRRALRAIHAALYEQPEEIELALLMIRSKKISLKEELIDLIAEENPDDGAEAIIQLFDLHSQDTEEDIDIRRLAFIALEEMNSDRAKQIASLSIDHQDYRIRRSAISYLLNLNFREYASVFLKRVLIEDDLDCVDLILESFENWKYLPALPVLNTLKSKVNHQELNQLYRETILVLEKIK